MVIPSNNASQRPSRVLAALDDHHAPPATPVASNLANSLKRPLPMTINEALVEASSQKRRDHLARKSYTPIKQVPYTKTDPRSLLNLVDGSFSGPPTTPSFPHASGSQFNLNYDDETPLRRIDIGGHDQGLRMAEFVTKSIDNLSHDLSVKDGMEHLNLKDNRDLLPGMEVRLLPHQIIGVAWMVRQEKSSRYKGGILADDMGLGKTVQMIALMTVNPPDLDDECRTTLIVVPAALLQQWKDEIEVKSNGVFTVHIHHGKDKLKKISALQSKDVVITTYQTLNGDFAVPHGIETDEEQAYISANGGILARVKWYRVVLDEAQFIRNRGTRSSRSVAMLRSKYRWMLTGTPVTNTLADLYGLIRFGRFRPWNDWNDFNTYIAKEQQNDAVLAGMRAQEILKPILLRRTKNSTLEGKPILQLPPKEIEIVKLDFSKEERDLYDSFEKKTKIRLSKFIRERTLVNNNAAVLAMILRMRQLCCHPHLILKMTGEYEDPTLLLGSASEKELGRAFRVMGQPWVTEVKQQFLARARATELLDFSDEGAPEATCPVCHDLFMEDSGRVLACKHEICFECLLELTNSAPAFEGEFGNGTEQENLRIEKEYESALTKGFRPCPTCKKMNDLTPAKVFKSSAFAPSDEELTRSAHFKRRRERYSRAQRNILAESDDEDNEDKPSPSTARDTIDIDDSDDELPDMTQFLAPQRKPSPKGTSNGAADGDTDMPDGSQRSNGNSRGKEKKASRKSVANGDMPPEAVISAWRNGDDDLEPSTKMLALVQLLKEWNATGDKVICFSQWTSMLDLVEKIFSRNGIRSLRYDGQMDRSSREVALATFRMAGGPKVMLISTKCGGVGLNLVSANRIINLDLSWNYAAESQAYDRVHRLGQEKEVFVKRLVVRDTIEERMLQLQDVKVGLAEAALGEGTGMKLQKLSIREIKLLFGMNSKNDANGREETIS